MAKKEPHQIDAENFAAASEPIAKKNGVEITLMPPENMDYEIARDLLDEGNEEGFKEYTRRGISQERDEIKRTILSTLIIGPDPVSIANTWSDLDQEAPNHHGYPDRMNKISHVVPAILQDRSTIQSVFIRYVFDRSK